LCGVTCMPGYDTHHGNFKASGYTFDEIVASLREATKSLRGLSTNPKAKLTGVFHDWGSMAGAMLSTRMNMEVPNYFSGLVYFDVLPPAHPSLQIPRAMGFKKTVVFTSYTSLFATTHATQRFLSHYMAVPVLAFGFVALKLLGLIPTGRLDRETFLAKKPRLSLRKIIYMQYPYFNMYKRLLLGQERFAADCHLPVSVEETPVLYMYGTEKRINFHDDNTFAWLEKEAKEGEKTRVVPVEKAGHWLYVHREDICYEAVKMFVLGK
jgi:pimeloyl-ACP methyl ester carboxylesterase